MLVESSFLNKLKTAKQSVCFLSASYSEALSPAHLRLALGPHNPKDFNPRIVYSGDRHGVDWTSLGLGLVATSFWGRRAQRGWALVGGRRGMEAGCGALGQGKCDIQGLWL